MKMKNTGLFEKVKCILTNECDSVQDYTNEIQQEEIQTETAQEDFQGFDIDSVFAN
jgi:hypothetical protein